MKRKDQVVIDNLNQSFIPKKKVTHYHGKLTLQLYADITHDMMDPERTYAFNVNKTAVKNEHALSYTSKLDIMGEKHNSTNIVDVELNQWKTEGLTQLKSNDELKVLSCHDHTGAPILNCADANGRIKPIQDGLAADCRPNNMIWLDGP